jgi:hypothetical protein
MPTTKSEPRVPSVRRVRQLIGEAYDQYLAWTGNMGNWEEQDDFEAHVKAEKAEVDRFFRHHFPGNKPR